jgi:hypothetical protein
MSLVGRETSQTASATGYQKYHWIGKIVPIPDFSISLDTGCPLDNVASAYGAFCAREGKPSPLTSKFDEFIALLSPGTAGGWTCCKIASTTMERW